MASVLKMELMPKEGGDTKFADMYAAYDALDDSTKEEIANLKGVHNYATWRIWENGKPLGMTDEQIAGIPDVVRLG